MRRGVCPGRRAPVTKAARCRERSENWPFPRISGEDRQAQVRAAAPPGALGCGGRPPQSWQARARAVPTRPRSRADRPGRRTGGQKGAGFGPSHDGAVFSAPSELSGPVCGANGER